MTIGEPFIPFETKEDLAAWFEINPNGKELWIKMAKKKTGIKSIYYEDALEVALCYGWIDGIRKAYDENFFAQRYTPRNPRSIWSKLNKDKVLQLIKENKMMPPGFAIIEVAKKNGNWDNAYSSSRKIEIPEDFSLKLKKNKDARLFFDTLNSVNRYAILHRIEKTKTDDKRSQMIEKFISMLEDKKKLY